MKEWILLFLATLAPVLLANLFYLLDSKTKFGKCAALRKQILIGVVFGILACFATQFGISYDGYVMNVRSAAPLTAGLVFGGPAGIIAGVIGALYRWFSVYWGVPSYTRVACSVATLLAGIISTLCRKFMFDKKKTSWFYGMFIAIAAEVFHMLLVFLTHMDDIARAFEVVRHTAVTMIMANAVSVLLSLLFVTLVSKEGFRRRKNARPISQTFAVYLFASVLIAFFATSAFTYGLQKNLGEMQVNELLTMNVRDVEADIEDAMDRDLLSRTQSITDIVASHAFFSTGSSSESLRQLLLTLLDQYGVSEINIVNADGVIEISSNPEYDGFRMNGDPNGQAAAFMCLFRGEKSYVQAYQPMDYDPAVKRKYAGISLSAEYFIQVGYDREHFDQSVRALLEYEATNRHIGQTGFIFILDPFSETPVISAPEGTVTEEGVRDFVGNLSELQDGNILSYTTPDGTAYYYLKDTVEGYVVIGCIPASEAFLSRDVSVYIGVFMQLTVFFVLFLLVFFLLKNIIVDNIHKINQSLAKITNGNLETRVEIQANEEFASLSNDINTTVARLKGYIEEAEKRIDMELAFAKSIQLSVLPSVFPPYPNRTEFEIFATMHTAKEVGGDFYDFYLLEENELVFLVADVSGKGIPAAMFMMNAKSVIKSLAESGLGAAEVLTAANEKLCATNEAGMFVTVWLGILNLKTGKVRYANAGHNPPLIRHKDGSCTYFRTHPGLVLAGMEGMRYKEGSVVLEPGDRILLYTDGVTEATRRDNELFGEERLLSAVDTDAAETAEETCRTVTQALQSFVGDAPQFDDITLLSLWYRGNPPKMRSMTFPAIVESIEPVTDFIDAELEAADCNLKALMQMNVAVDELFGNIAHYAYPDGTGDATVEISVEGDTATVTFIDSGVPFDPLAKGDPDVSLSAEERTVGGLGIFMVKKTMDAVRYTYEDGKNKLTVQKTIH